MVIAPPHTPGSVVCVKSLPRRIGLSSTHEGFSSRAMRGFPKPSNLHLTNRAARPPNLNLHRVGAGGGCGRGPPRRTPPPMALGYGVQSLKRWSSCISVGGSRMLPHRGKCPNLPLQGNTRSDGGGQNPPPSSPLYVYPVPPRWGTGRWRLCSLAFIYVERKVSLQPQFDMRLGHSH